MMALPEWKVERINLGEAAAKSDGWKFSTALLVTCPRCDNAFIMPLSWKRKNKYGTAPCPVCFKTNRIPRYR
jgi:hypothetical protein